jgi:hypothetical protein
MLLWQLGLDAACSSGGEAATGDIDATFGTEKQIFYIADNDAPGRKAASRKQAACPRLRVCYPDPRPIRT